MCVYTGVACVNGDAKHLFKGIGGHGVWCHFQQYYNYIMAVSFYWLSKPEYWCNTTKEFSIAFYVK